MIPHFLILLDNSGSMYGEKILCLNQVVTNLLDNMKSIRPEPAVALVPFDNGLSSAEFIPASQAEPVNYIAEGNTSLPDVSQLIKNTNITVNPSELITILVSDGNYVPSRILPPGPAYAIAVGYDARKSQLDYFTKNADNVLPAHASYDLPTYAIQRSCL